MPTKRKPAPTGSYARAKSAGKHRITLDLLADDHALLLAAAQLEGRPLSQFVTHHAKQVAATVVQAAGKR